MATSNFELARDLVSERKGFRRRRVVFSRFHLKTVKEKKSCKS